MLKSQHTKFTSPERSSKYDGDVIENSSLCLQI